MLLDFLALPGLSWRVKLTPPIHWILSSCFPYWLTWKFAMFKPDMFLVKLPILALKSASPLFGYICWYSCFAFSRTSTLLMECFIKISSSSLRTSHLFSLLCYLSFALQIVGFFFFLAFFNIADNFPILYWYHCQV